MRNLIRCQYCTDYKKTLGEILPNGMVAIQRHRGGYFNPNLGQWVDGDYTVVNGTFSLTCGNCGHIAYTKGEDENTNFGSERIYRFTLVETVIRLGTPSYTNNTGSII